MKKLIRRLFTLRAIEIALVFLLGKFPENQLLKKLRPWNAYYPRGSLRQCLRAGVRYRLDISDYQDWLLYFHSNDDSSFGVLDYLAPGFVVLDIGGNIGQTAMMMGLKIGAGGRVCSFEPFPETYQKFLHNLSLNQSTINNVRAEGFALGAEVGELQMYETSAINSGGNRMVGNEQGEKAGLVTVPVSTVDAFVRSARLGRIDFIKIDVEGFEMNVLKGARETLTAHRPSLYIELDDRNLRSQGSSAEELCDYLRRSGYQIREHGQTRPLSASDYVRHMDIYCSPASLGQPAAESPRV